MADYNEVWHIANASLGRLYTGYLIAINLNGKHYCHVRDLAKIYVLSNYLDLLIDFKNTPFSLRKKEAGADLR